MADCVALLPVYGPVIDDPAWDTGFSTGEYLSGDFYIAFTADKNAQGAVAGVNAVDTTPHFGDIDHGFAFADSKVRPIERGTYVGPDWSAYNSDDLFIVMRLGTTVYYLRGFAYNYDTQVYYDDLLPGIPLPGAIMWVSQTASYYPVQTDIALFGISDSVCVIDSGSNWSEAAQLDNASMVGELRFDIVAASGYGAESAQLEGTLTMSGSATSTAVEGVYAGTLSFDIDAGDIERTRLAGTLPFQGGLDGGKTGISTTYNSDLYHAGRLSGYIQFTGVASGEPFTPSGVSAGQLEFLVKGAADEFIDMTYDAGVDGSLVFDIAGVGTPLASNIENGAALLLAFEGQAAGSEGTGEIEAALASTISFDIQGAGTAYPDNELITAVVDGQILFTMAAIGTPLHTNYFNIVLPELGDSPLLESFSVEILDSMRVSAAQQARLVNLVREFISLASAPRTFSHRSTEVTDIALATVRILPDFALVIADQFLVTATMDARAVVLAADQVLAQGYVQTFTQALAAVVSAMMVSDTHIDEGAGSDGGATGGGTIIDAVGTLGDPMVIQLLGWFRAGAVVGLAYTTDLPSENTIVYTVPEDMVAWQVAAELATLLNAAADIAATHTGSGIIEITPAGGATTVNL